MVTPRGELDPLPVRLDLPHVRCEPAEEGLGRGGGAGLPLVEGRPGGLDRFDDAFFEVGAVLLHHDDGLLEQVFFEDLALKLPVYGNVGDVPGRSE